MILLIGGYRDALGHGGGLHEGRSKALTVNDAYGTDLERRTHPSSRYGESGSRLGRLIDAMGDGGEVAVPLRKSRITPSGVRCPQVCGVSAGWPAPTGSDSRDYFRAPAADLELGQAQLVRLLKPPACPMAQRQR